MTTLNIDLDPFIDAIRAGADPYDAYTAQPTTDSSRVDYDLDKEVLSVFKSLKQRFSITPEVVMQADAPWSREAEMALETTDTVDGLEVALARDPTSLEAFQTLMAANKDGVAHGAYPDMFCHFYLSDTSGDMRVYMNVKAQNAGAVIMFLLEKLKAGNLDVAKVIGGFKFPYVRSSAHKRRDVLVIWTDSAYLDELIAAITEVQKPMGNAFLDGPPLTSGSVAGLRGVGFAPHLHERGYSYGSFLAQQRAACGEDKGKWRDAITRLYERAGLDATLHFN